MSQPFRNVKSKMRDMTSDSSFSLSFFFFALICHVCQTDFKAKSIKQDKRVVYHYKNVQSQMKI